MVFVITTTKTGNNFNVYLQENRNANVIKVEYYTADKMNALTHVSCINRDMFQKCDVKKKCDVKVKPSGKRI